MSKSPAVIGAMGLAGCLALSMIMRSALQVQQRQQRDPLEAELETRFGSRLSAPPVVSETEREGRRRVVVELSVLAGLKKERFVAAAGRLVWERRRGSASEPAEVEVVVTDDGDGERVAGLVPRPRFWPSQADSPPPRAEPTRGGTPGR